MKELTNGIYGILRGGALKKNEDISESEMSNVEMVLVVKDHTSVIIKNSFEPYGDVYSDEKAELYQREGYRLPTRHELIDILDMCKESELLKFMSKVGYRDISLDCVGNIWTCEEIDENTMWAKVASYQGVMQPWSKKLNGYYIYVKPFDYIPQ